MSNTTQSIIINLMKARELSGKKDTMACDLFDADESLGSSKKVYAELVRLERMGKVKRLRFYPMCSNGCIVSWVLA